MVTGTAKGRVLLVVMALLSGAGQAALAPDSALRAELLIDNKLKELAQESLLEDYDRKEILEISIDYNKLKVLLGSKLGKVVNH